MSNDNSIIRDVKDILITELEKFCPNNVFLQGTLNSEAEYPQKFVTFFVSMTELNAYYDNDPNEANFYISVIFYSDNPAEIPIYAQSIMDRLYQAGFILEDAGNDVLSGIHTHTGWAMDFIYSKRSD